MRKILFLILLIIFIFGGVKTLSAEDFDTNVAPLPGQESYTDKEDKYKLAKEVLHFVNIEREKNGSPPLKFSKELSEFAKDRVVEIPQKFSHTRPDGSSCFTAIKMPYRALGENIAAGQPTPEVVVKEWMDSPGHRKNILDVKYTEMGLAYLYDPDSEYKTYWVQFFRG